MVSPLFEGGAAIAAGGFSNLPQQKTPLTKGKQGF
jgi:hypothetical protein